MITYLGMTAPMALFALISWLRNPYNGNRSEVRVNRISGIEWVLMSLLTVAVTGKKDFRVELELADEAIAAPEKTAAVYALLHKAQISYELKTAIFEAVSAKENPDRILGNLYQMNLDSGLLGAVTEQIICDR